MATRIAARGEVKAAILNLLESAPSGKSARQVGLALSRDRSQMLTRLAELAQQGKVVSVQVQSTGRPTQLWFHAMHREQAEHAGPLGWGGAKAKRAKTVAKALEPKPAVRADGGGPIVVEAPKFVDRRFEPVGEIPRVVDSSQARPWAVAATARARVSGAA